jgi:hypothetical protein
VIKLNLLPPYINERRRMLMAIVVFVVLLLPLAFVIFELQSGWQQQEAWYNTEAQNYTTYTSSVSTYQKGADDVKSAAGQYKDWITTFGDLAPSRAYCQKTAQSLIEAGNLVSGGGSWMDQMEVFSDGTVKTKGKIKGTMQFLAYYFRLKDKGCTLDPAVQPAPMQKMTDTVPLVVSGKVTALPSAITLPGSGKNNWSDLYQSVSGQSGSGGGGNPFAGGGNPFAGGGNPFAGGGNPFAGAGAPGSAPGGPGGAPGGPGSAPGPGGGAPGMGAPGGKPPSGPPGGGMGGRPGGKGAKGG